MITNDKENGGCRPADSPQGAPSTTLLNTIDSPEQLRKLPVSALPQVCSESASS